MNAELRHGYTLDDIHDIAVYAVSTDRWRPSLYWADRVAAAWSAVAIALYEAAAPPRRRELVFFARDASGDVVDAAMRHHGIDKRGATFGEGRVNFARYWERLADTPVEDRVTDLIALGQIWPTLDGDLAEALLALAAHEDYRVAAESLGLRYNTYCARVRHARLRFLRLWHEGERPSGVWGRDRRRGRDGTGLTAVRVLRRRRPR